MRTGGWRPRQGGFPAWDFVFVAVLATVLACNEPFPEDDLRVCPCMDGWTCHKDVCRKDCSDGGSCPPGTDCDSKTKTCLPDQDEPPCKPNCQNVECGGDGCGGSCGTCSGGKVCKAGLCTAGGGGCEPQCYTPEGAIKECGLDGCGGYCGSCKAGVSCQNGFCAASGSGQIGSACLSDAQCFAGDVPFCVSGDSFPGGYCTSACNVQGAAGDCPIGSTCYSFEGVDTPVCLDDCSSESDCRPGYTCWEGEDSNRYCFP